MGTHEEQEVIERREDETSVIVVFGDLSALLVCLVSRNLELADWEAVFVSEDPPTKRVDDVFPR